MPTLNLLRPWALALVATLTTLSALRAQTNPSPPNPPRPAAAAASAPASAPATSATASATTSAPAPAASAPAAAAQKVEITGGRASDTDERRRATASKIVIGREEIDKFGDATVGEVLRRLPGVTTPGAPGRGGPPRLRGLGNGFTQLLIDGQRIPPGFSLESLTPEQVERIEILRAPTAETGARAIAGTINIITREGFKRRLNDLRVGGSFENDQAGYGLNWTHNDNAGPLTYNLSGSAFGNKRENSNTTTTTVADTSTGALLEDRSSTSSTLEDRTGLNLTTRLQWRLNESGDMLMLMPSVFHSEASSSSRFNLDQRVRSARTPLLYDFGNGSTDSSFTNGRLGAQWRQRVGDVRLEVNGNGGAFRARSDTQRFEYSRRASEPMTRYADQSRTEEKSGLVNLKASTLLGGKEAQPGSEHTLVSGLEAETTRRTEFRSTTQDGRDTGVGFGDNLQASSLRLAAYAQDEWNISPNWSAYAGLRWEGISTRGDTAELASGERRPTNRSSVWTPLAHAVWKPDPKSRDQVRMSLTRSYRSPPLAQLIARPTINRDFPATGPTNPETSPDTAGNPNLKPELATGIDVAFERYLESGGVLSANVFRRNISNLMRNVTALETVSYSSQKRYVRRQQNIGDAVTQGIELEAKFRLDQVIEGSPGVELRSNLSFFDSKVKAVPGPDNRLDQQAKATANFGADYRLRGIPLSLGGNVNWVPGYTTRIEADQTLAVDRKTVWDAYALWTFTPSAALRVLGSNLDPRDYATLTVNDTVVANTTERTTVRSSGPSYINWQMRLELKL